MLAPPKSVEIGIGRLDVGIELLEDVKTADGRVLVRKATPLTEAIVKSLYRRKERGETLSFFISDQSRTGKIAKLSRLMIELVDQGRYHHVFGVPDLKTRIERVLLDVLFDVINDDTIYDYINECFVLRGSGDDDSFTIRHPMNVFVLTTAAEITHSRIQDKELLKSLGFCALIHDMALADVEPEDGECILSHPREVIDCFRERLSYREKGILLHHHENLDGSGYPYGLQGDQVDYCSNLLAVCDVFDLLINNYLDCPDRRPELDHLEQPVEKRGIFQALLDIVSLSNRGVYNPVAVKSLVSFFNQKELLSNPALVDDLRRIPTLCPCGGASVAKLGPEQSERPSLVHCMDPDRDCSISENPRGSWGRAMIDGDYQEFQRCLALTEILTDAYRSRVQV